MRAVVQRVLRAEVRVDGEVTGRIQGGLCVLVGVGQGDATEDARKLAEKVVSLRIFNDHDGRMNRSLLDVGGGLLAVSQFTLWGDVRRGKRPSFTAAMEPQGARQLFDSFCEMSHSLGIRVEKGRFGADMKLDLVGDGPVTLLLDTERQF